MNREMAGNSVYVRKPAWIAVVLVALTAISFSCLSHAEEPVSQSASAPSKAKSNDTQDAAANQAKIEKKLSKILENEEALLKGQQALSQKLDAILEELRIIKVRSTH